ncbi:pyruvate carboxylase [Chitinophaga parva]|nr:pyruvate carboxylase [Chitinophaga parva]
MSLRKIQKLLVANRGEIAVRVLRAAAELRIRTVAIFTYEDRYSLHRFKADEAYQVGPDDAPLKPYLDIEAILYLAKAEGVDAIHPGYGFLSENVQFARRCQEEGIIFIGPRAEVMAQLGDKVAAKAMARQAGIPMIADSQLPLLTAATALQEAARIGFPVIIKAAAGGGGRGMRVVHTPALLEAAWLEARSEAEKAFGDGTVFLEKFIAHPKHIEVQLLGDNYGNIVHLYERDCSVQRRFQKVVEIAPSPNLPVHTRNEIHHYALQLARAVGYNNAGTVEFLVDEDHRVYFIEVNPRIQVEHTVTEAVTGIDLVRSQILIAQGHQLSDPEIFLGSQEAVQVNGFAIQCRITTEDPENHFKPDYGTVIAYRNAGGFGIRLDEGSTYSGVKISPFFDSLLVKVTAWGRTLGGACGRMHRTLREFRIRGVKTNMRFLENVINHDIFRKGNCTVSFIDQHPELFHLGLTQDRGTKALLYLADVTVNGHPDIKHAGPHRRFRTPAVPPFDAREPFPPGQRDRLKAMGRERFSQWLRNEQPVYFTDTTFRDAHQSLLATRVRTRDMLAVAEGFARQHPQLFSMEVWGGATFDVALRFLHECPWARLRQLRKAMPNMLLQMLFRGTNAVGYGAYPESLTATFIEKAWEQGIDVFRIFDSLNNAKAMAPSIRFVRERTEALAQAAISYTGDVRTSSKYNLQYYTDLAKRLEDAGAHLLCIKDMAGLLKPAAAPILVHALREAVQLPVVLHTHDTSSLQGATYLNAIDAGVNVVDVAIASLSGLTSQPNFNALAAALEGHPRAQHLDVPSLNAYSNYWEDVREYYYPFESDLKAGTAQVYENEIPGGQYSNLRQQAESLGLGDKLELIKHNYQVVNQLFGDIIKVTPSSKTVGDMALFMTANNLDAAAVLDETRNLAFPASVVDFFRGALGEPYGGFPEKLQRIVLKGEKAMPEAPVVADFDQDMASFQLRFPHTDVLDYLSYRMFPKVFEEYYHHRQRFGNVESIPTPAFFYGLKQGEEILITLSKGKTILVKLQYVLPADEHGMCWVEFELNGYARRIQVRDHKVKSIVKSNRKVGNPGHEIGAPLQGKLSKLLVAPGDKVMERMPLFIIEAMKMETTVTATRNAVIKAIHLAEGAMVMQDDMVVELHEAGASTTS